jgi:hypothetical protein
MSRLPIAIGLSLLIAEVGSADSGPVSHFIVSPLDFAQIREIIPLGNLNPVGGHVFPTDHVCLDYGRRPGLTVWAPAAGTVTAIRDQLRGDFKIEIRVDENISYYLAHLELEPGIRVGGQLSARQKLGQASGKSMLDLGASDIRVHLPGFVNPNRYPQPTIQAVAPLSLFSEPLRAQLYSKVTRNGPNKDGKIDLDRPGALVGNWFHESLAVEDSSRGEPQVWAKQLAFAYDVRDPVAVRISIGGTIAPAGLYAVQPGAPDPAKVSAETALVKYRLARIGGENSGLLLVQLLGVDRLTVEYFAGSTSDDVKDFDQRASIYER